MNISMTKIIFSIYDEFALHVDEAIHEWGFQNRSEFFRFAALDFILRNKGTIPPKEMVEDYTKAIRQVQARRRQSFTDIE
jgi:metal-responsive CopG/Arc/MetJ family transcriptional regulator